MSPKKGEIKQFEDILLSNRVVVSDPCYPRDVWCRGEVDITPGTYEAFLHYGDEDRVSKLRLVRKGAGDVYNEVSAPFSVGVDSGQAGIFCDTVYPTGSCTGEYGEKGTFYGDICELTAGSLGGTYQGKGLVSSSGYGDGAYTCIVGTDEDGNTCFLEIGFMDDSEEDYCASCGGCC
jgi:hypothetical protein